MAMTFDGVVVALAQDKVLTDKFELLIEDVDEEKVEVVGASPEVIVEAIDDLEEVDFTRRNDGNLRKKK